MPEGSAEAFDPSNGCSSPQEVDWLLIDADWVVTCDRSMRRIRGGSIAIEGTTLVAVGPTEQVRSSFRGRCEVDLQGYLVLPGLINTHTHAAMSCLRGLGDDLPLQRWLHEVIFPAEARHVNPELVYWGTMLAAVEMLQNGVTTFCDGYFFEESAVRAVKQVGVRAILGQGILDFPSPDLPDPGRSRRRAEEFLDFFPTNQTRLRPSLFCHAPYTCGPKTLQWVKALCRERGIIFQLHLSETAAEIEQITKLYKDRPVFYLDRLNLLDNKTVCAHAVWLQSDEIELLAARHVGVSHNAESNMKLASGVAPVPAMLKAGIHVGLGTDSCASNNDLDLLTEMDRVAKLHKVFQRDPVVCTAMQVLNMATRGGAAVLNWDEEIGSLEVGKKADLIAVDLRQPHLTPIYDPVSHLVYTIKGSDVRHVWVNGSMVVADGQIKTLDAAAVMNEVNRIARKVKV
jgi:5-methylthioadenosine/S-adenosylhomocysteine deaminase